MIIAIIGEHNSKVKVCALFPRIWIHVSHKRGELMQRRILPGVDLQLVGGHVAVHVLRDRMMPARGAEYPQQQRAGLQWQQEEEAY